MKRIIPAIILSVCLSSCGGNILSYFVKSSDIIYEGNGDGSDRYCSDKTLYLPDTGYLDHFPMKYVRLNFHFMRNPNDANQFDLQIARDFAREILNCGNYKLYVNAKMNLPIGNKTPRLPVRYRYRIETDESIPGDDGIYIHDEPDPKLAYFYNSGPDFNIFDRDIYDKYGTGKNEVLNVFILSHPPDSLGSNTYRNAHQGVGYNEFVKMAIPHNGFSSFNSQKNQFVHLGTNYCGLLNHEIGHSLGLQHTWNSNDGCDDTPKNPGCWNRSGTPPCDGAVSNNMMDYNSVQDAITPCQLYNIYYRMSKHTSTQRQLLEPTWCTYRPEATIMVAPFENIEWKTSKDLEGDVIVQNSATLTIYCRVNFPARARILVKPGGTLIIDGGLLTNACDDQWLGIEIKEKSRKKGTVIIKNGGSIQNTVNPL